MSNIKIAILSSFLLTAFISTTTYGADITDVTPTTFHCATVTVQTNLGHDTNTEEPVLYKSETSAPFKASAGANTGVTNVPFVTTDPVGVEIPSDAQVVSVNCRDYVAYGQHGHPVLFYLQGGTYITNAGKTFGCRITTQQLHTTYTLYADARVCWDKQ